MSAPLPVRPGSLVAWWNQGALDFAFVVGEEKRRVVLVRSRGKQERVQPSRLVLEVASGGPIPGSTLDARREAAEHLERVVAELRRRAAGVDVGLLWRIVAEDLDPDTAGPPMALEELAGLALDAEDGAARAALLLALLDDGLHFVRRGDAWEARPSRVVESLRTEREQVARRDAEMQSAVAAFRAAMAGREPFRPTGSEVERKLLDALDRVAVLGDDAPRPAVAVALDALSAVGLRYDRPSEGAFRLLRGLGHFTSDDENLELRRHDLPLEFPDPVLRHARHAVERGWEPGGREDRTGVEVVTIDGPKTREIDDALSLEPTDEGWRVGIHIADPTAFVRIDDPVDREALTRAVTHYLPDRRLTMLPAELCECAASLVEGRDRPALSFLVDLDREGEIRAYRIVRSVVRSRSRLDYDGVDRAVGSGGGDPHGELLRELDRVAGLRETARIRAGALALHAPEVDVFVAADGTIGLERMPARSSARRMVSEAMILAGDVGARFCRESGLPAIYRRQAPATDLPPLPPDGIDDPVMLRRVRRRLKRGEIGLEPGPHFSLGLAAYAQVTSPLRRYQDLAVHRQIAAHLAGHDPAYEATALQRIAATTEQAEIVARRLERASEEYWLLRYLERDAGKVVDAVVVEDEPRPVVRLDETLWEQPMPSLAGVRAGERVRVLVQRVNPRAGLLVLRGAD